MAIEHNITVTFREVITLPAGDTGKVVYVGVLVGAPSQDKELQEFSRLVDGVIGRDWQR